MTTIQDIADKMGISKSAVSKALNNAPDISENLRKQVLETAVALGYTKLRRYRNSVRKICVLIEKDNIQYEEPYHFAYDIIMGFRQMAEPQGFDVVIEPVDIQIQRNQPYDVYMLEHDYVGSFVIGFSLADPWLKDFENSCTPTVLYDNYITGNPSTKISKDIACYKRRKDKNKRVPSQSTLSFPFFLFFKVDPVALPVFFG